MAEPDAFLTARLAAALAERQTMAQNYSAIVTSINDLALTDDVPGVLAAVNHIVSEVGANIDAQHLATSRDIGYLVMDINREVSDEVSARISALPMNVRTRILY